MKAIRSSSDLSFYDMMDSKKGKEKNDNLPNASFYHSLKMHKTLQHRSLIASGCCITFFNLSSEIILAQGINREVHAKVTTICLMQNVPLV